MTEIKVKAQFSLSELMAEFEKTKVEQDRDALTAKEIRDVLSIGMKNRSVGETAMNAHSSRSHSLF